MASSSIVQKVVLEEDDMELVSDEELNDVEGDAISNIHEGGKGKQEEEGEEEGEDLQAIIEKSSSAVLPDEQQEQQEQQCSTEVYPDDEVRNENTATEIE